MGPWSRSAGSPSSQAGASGDALVRLVNDLENIPDTDGGGGGLSPRLEAELIAMLTRPTATQSTTAERTLAATLFGLLGMMAGVLGILAFLGFNQFARSVQDQAEKVDRIAASIDHASAAHRLALETLLATSESSEHDPDALVKQFGKTARRLR